MSARRGTFVIDSHERELLLAALNHFYDRCGRVGSTISYSNTAHKLACEFTQARIDELRNKISEVST